MPPSTTIPPREPGDVINRYDKRPSPIGRTLFTLFRALDPVVQYSILSSSFPILGLRRLPPGPPLSSPYALGLSPHRLLLLLMATGSSVKQIMWLHFIDEKRMAPSGALITGGWNIFVNSLNTVLSTLPLLSTAGSPSEALSPIPAPVLVGVCMYIVGNVLETASEVQRKLFKMDKRNNGKVYNKGLFATARHVNFGGYTLWRCGFTLAAAGWAPAAGMFVFLLWAFTNNGIPALDNYCAKRVRKDFNSGVVLER